MWGNRNSAVTSNSIFRERTLRSNLRSQASGLALRSALGLAAAAGASVLAPGQASANCVLAGVSIDCNDTSTTNTTYPANPPSDRAYQGPIATPIILTVDPGATVS